MSRWAIFGSLPSRKELVRSSDHVDRGPADPGLNAEPTAGDQREQRRHIGAANSERRPAINGKRDSIFSARMRIEHHRHQYDHVPQKNRKNCLPPVHPLLDEARSEHVCRNARRHADPQHGDVLHPPASTRQAPAPYRGCNKAIQKGRPSARRYRPRREKRMRMPTFSRPFPHCKKSA